MQFPEHGTLLRLMTMHPAQDVVQHVDRLYHVRSLVEHDALCPVGHRRVGNLSPRRQAVLRQALEHLGRPDYRHVGGFAEPQDLLLHLGQPLEATFHGEISTSDHDATAGRLQGFQQHRRKVFKAVLGLDLEHDGGLPIAQRSQELLECADILDRVDERERHHVRVIRDKRQIRPVLVGHGGEVQVAVGQVDALVGDKLRPASARVRNANVQAIWLRAFDDASDAPIVEPHPLARLSILEHLRRGATDGGGIQHVTDPIADSRPAGDEFARQREQIARCQAIAVSTGGTAPMHASATVPAPSRLARRPTSVVR